jgi:hypothetical protein
MAGKKLSELSSGSLSNLPLSGVTAVVYSGSTFQHTLSHLRSILVDSGSHVFTGSQVINGGLTVNGSLIANEYILSSSITNIEVQDVSGSSVFGNDMLDTHQFTGSILVTGSVNASNLVGKEFLFVSGFAVIGDPIHHSGSDPEALHVGNSNSYNIAHFKGDNEYYSQVYISNHSSGSNASSDLVVVADNGTETNHYIDLGINSSTYTGGLVGRENDAYLLNVGKDMYIGTIGGENHPSKLFLFGQNSWENPQITVSGSGQVSFNTGSVSSGYTYEFSGSAKMQNDLNVSGSVTASYFVGDGSQLTNLPLNTNWNNGKEYVIRNTEQLTFSGDYILEDSNLLIEGGETEIEYASNKYFFKVGSIFIGGNLLVKDSYIQNNGKISVGGEVILIGNSQITGNGIII